MVNFLFTLNDPAYGTERSYNALRLAGSLPRDTEYEVKVFRIVEGAACAYRNQKLPQGHYNIEIMLKTVMKYGGEVGVCASCMDARGLVDTELVARTDRSSLEQLTAWTGDVHEGLVF